jgi:ABC-2 type transport system ATP-binding protein
MDESLSIKATGLTKRFGDVAAVKDLSLNIYPGEIYGFLGLNGAGKTTTIRMLLGMIKPGTGSVSLFGKKIHPGQQSIWQRVGYMVETPHAYPDLTVRENLEIMRHLYRIENANAVPEIIEELGLTNYASQRAKTLSLGNAQRLGLAKALIHRPDLLILDEPANGLDPAGIVEIRNLLHGLAYNSGVTVFVSSHILGEIARLSTRIGIIHEGRLIKELNTGDLAEQEKQHLVVDVNDTECAVSALKNAGIDALPCNGKTLKITRSDILHHPDRIVVALVQANCPPTRLVIEQADLESYFLELVGLKKAEKDEYCN